MTEAEIRAAHPDWTEGQVAAEVARLAAQPTPPPEPPPAPPEPVKPENDGRDAAMAEMRRKTDEADRRAKAAEEALAERDRKEAEEQGRWEEIAKKAEADKAALQAQIAEGEARAAAAVARSNALQSATDLKFKDPGYALYKLEQQSVNFGDAPAVKAALDSLAVNHPDLLAEPSPVPPSGGPPAPPPGGTTPPVSGDRLRAMDAKEVAAFAKADPAGYRAALAAAK